MHRLWRWLIARHFTAGIPAALYRRVQTHLQDCPDCRTQFDRHLDWESLLPDAEQRVGARLVRQAEAQARAKAEASTQRQPIWAWGLASAAAAALLLIVVMPGEAPPEYQARGAQQLGQSSLRVLARPPGAAAFEPLRGPVPAGSELGFRVDNPEGHRQLLLLLRDATGELHNLYPAHSGGEPLALDGLAPGAALPEVFRPELPAGSVDLLALFTSQTVDLAELERLFADPDLETVARALSHRGRLQLKHFRVVVEDGGRR